MTIDDAYAPVVDPKTFALGRLVSALAEDAIFGLSCGGGSDTLDGLGKRRGEAYSAILAGHRLNTMSGEFDNWVVELTRAVAPICPPAWMPMAEVIREKVTLEAGARGLRSFFSSKPSDKDIQRVKRLGTLAVRVLRAVFVADGALDVEETRTLAGLVASLGLPDSDAQPLFAEPPVNVEQLDVYGDIEPAVAKALLRGAWLAAAWDQIDPREEHVVRVLANKLSYAAMDLEVLRNEAVQRVDTRRLVGLATVDAVRFVLSDRAPGHGVILAAKAGSLMIPRRYREEALAQIGAGTRVTLAKRYPQLTTDDRQTVLGIAWAAAMYEDPSLARRALLRARHDRVAADLGEDGAKPRHGVVSWIEDVLAPAAFPMGAD
jgi:tellurite resistance protein